MNIPVITPAVTAQRRLLDILSVGDDAAVTFLLFSSFIPLLDKLPVFRAKPSYLFHQKIRDLFMSAYRIALAVKFIQVDRLSEPDPHFFTPGPISEYLSREVVYQSGNEHRYNLRPCGIYYFPNPRLSRKKLIWIGA
jgi:hypothetical protein